MSESKAFASFAADLAAERKSKNAVGMGALSVKNHSREMERENARRARLQKDAEEHGEIFDIHDYE